MVAFLTTTVTFDGSRAKEITSVPLPTAGRTPLVEVLVDGRRTVRLMVDPGNETLIDASIAKELALVPGEDGRVELPNLSIGGVALGSVNAGTWSASALNPGAVSPDGFLALSTFEDYLLTLDYAHERLVLQEGALPEPDGQEVLAYELNEESAITIPVVVAGTDVRLRMDAGAVGDLMLAAQFADRLPLADEPGRIGKSITEDGREVDILGARLDGEATIGKHVIKRPGISFSEAFSEGMVGFDALAHFAITLDQKARRIRLRADADPGRFLLDKAANLPALEEGGAPLREFFNANSDKVHLVTLLSPTCPGCIRGARVVQEKVLDHNNSEDLLVDVVWIPVLRDDSHEAAIKAQKLIPDARAHHFWDGDQALGRAYGRAVELPRGRDLAWDVYFGFARGTTWGEDLPVPDDWAHQLGMDDRHLKEGDGLQAFMDDLIGE